MQVKISLNASLPYRIWLHDPDFFLVTWNPSSVPAVEITLDLDTATTGFQYIGVEELRHLDRDGAPCTDYQEEGASFSDCVVAKMVEAVGCKVTLNNIILTMVNDIPQSNFSQHQWYNFKGQEKYQNCTAMEDFENHIVQWIPLLAASLESVVKWVSAIYNVAKN